MATNLRSGRDYWRLRQRFFEQCAATGTPCWLCGQSIDYSLPWRDDDGTVNDEAFELDHLHPVSTHPELVKDPANFRASHRECNRNRANKKAINKIGIPSRRWHV